ncbi:restriction endonuclease [Bacillus haynesii]|uniref:restriction endonuclease n=1 Tax=Bacillus haynesii TaxID=1925021 RepID=UPI002DB8169A|nr:restriction endonuclease [Bacillus haynesii]
MKLAIPDFQAFMYPFLILLKDKKKEHSLQEAYSFLAEHFQLTDEEKEERLPSGKQLVYHNRIGWARTYLSKAGLLRIVRRATFVITESGQELINDPSINKLSKNDLLKYKGIQTFLNQKSEGEVFSEKEVENELTPQEQIDKSYEVIQQQIKEELLDKVKSCTPEFFERLVVELLVAMGYGGSIQDAGKAIGRSGDGGIDGIIKEDILGLDMLYVQAKRWEGNVGRPEIQKFAGSLEGHRAKKGVFITTSEYTISAKEYINQIEKKIILINGKELAEYMLKYGIGVSEVTTYTIKKIDLDYFDE